MNFWQMYGQTEQTQLAHKRYKIGSETEKTRERGQHAKMMFTARVNLLGCLVLHAYTVYHSLSVQNKSKSKMHSAKRKTMHHTCSLLLLRLHLPHLLPPLLPFRYSYYTSLNSSPSSLTVLCAHISGVGNESMCQNEIHGK